MDRPAPDAPSDPATTVATGNATHPSGRLIAVAIAVAVLATLLGAAVADRLDLGPVDDAYISLRYATHWANGSGLTFNPGEQVEGYTNFLLVAVEAIAIRSGVDPETAMRAAGFASLGLLGGTLAWFLGTFALPGRPVAAGLVALAGTLNLALVCWAASGMEVCLFSALALAAVLVPLQPGLRFAAPAGALSLCAAALARPEAVALLPIAAWAAFSRRRRGRDAAILLATFAATYGIYFAIRWTHFGDLLPNAFYAKLDYGNAALSLRGLRYVGQFAVAAPLLVLGAIVAATGSRRAEPWLRTSLAAAATLLLVVVYEGGDHFAMFRFAAPVLPFLTLAAIPALGQIARRVLPERRRPAAVAIAAVVALVLSGVAIGVPTHRDGLGMNHLRRFGLESECAREWSSIGRWLRDAAPSDATVATIAVGAIGYHSGLKIYDPHGVVNRAVAHRRQELGRGYAGHEKYDVDDLLFRPPSYALLQNRITAEPVLVWDLPDRVWGDFNKTLLADPRFVSSYRYHVLRIAPGSFVGLHARNDLAPPGTPASRGNRVD